MLVIQNFYFKSDNHFSTYSIVKKQILSSRLTTLSQVSGTREFNRSVNAVLQVYIHHYL